MPPLAQLWVSVSFAWSSRTVALLDNVFRIMNIIPVCNRMLSKNRTGRADTRSVLVCFDQLALPLSLSLVLRTLKMYFILRL